MAMQEAILCPQLVPVADLIQSLIHKRPDIKQNLDSVSAILNPKDLAKFPWAQRLIKLTTMTGFKKMTQSCHEVVSEAILDAENQSKAQEVNNEIALLTEEFQKIGKKEHLEFGDFMKVLSAVISLQALASSLPQGAGSAHAAIREQAMTLVDAQKAVIEQLASQTLNANGRAVVKSVQQFSSTINGQQSTVSTVQQFDIYLI